MDREEARGLSSEALQCLEIRNLRKSGQWNARLTISNAAACLTEIRIENWPLHLAM